MNCKRLPKFYEGVATAKLQDYLTTELKLPTPPNPGAEKQHMLGLIPTDTYRFNMSYRKLKAPPRISPRAAWRPALPSPRRALDWAALEERRDHPRPPASLAGGGGQAGRLSVRGPQGWRAVARLARRLPQAGEERRQQGGRARRQRARLARRGGGRDQRRVPGLQGMASGVEARRPRCQGRRQGQGDAARALLPGCDPRRGERGAGSWFRCELVPVKQQRVPASCSHR